METVSYTKSVLELVPGETVYIGSSDIPLTVKEIGLLCTVVETGTKMVRIVFSTGNFSGSEFVEPERVYRMIPNDEFELRTKKIH